MFAYYLRQDIGYFLMSTAFLIVYLVMMFSIVMQRRSVVEVYERGLRFKKDSLTWQEIESVSGAGEVVLKDRRRVQLPKSVVAFDAMISDVRGRI